MTKLRPDSALLMAICLHHCTDLQNELGTGQSIQNSGASYVVICIIGASCGGLVSAACFSEFGWNVWCIDKNADRIEQLTAPMTTARAAVAHRPSPFQVTAWALQPPLPGT